MSYIEKLLLMIKKGEIPSKPGVLQHVSVAHDDWCNIHKGKNCSCDPDITEGKPDDSSKSIKGTEIIP